MKNRTRRAVALTAAVVCAVFLLSAFAVVFQSEHDCAGDGCPVCAGIAAFFSSLRFLFAVPVSAGVLFAAGPVLRSGIPLRPDRSGNRTPIALKVKLTR